MKVIADGRLIGEVDAFEIGEPGFLPPPPAPMVVWDEAFAVEQLERMMRGAHYIGQPPSLNPCAEIPLGPPQSLKIVQVDDSYYPQALARMTKKAP